MTEMRELMIDSATKILNDLSTKDVVNKAEEEAWSEQLWNTMAESGMTAVAVSEEHGGIGGDYGDALNILRVCGKYSAPIPIVETLLVNWLLSEKGKEPSEQPLTIMPIEQKDEVTFTAASGGMSVSGKIRKVPWARIAEAILVIGKSENGYKMALVDSKQCQIDHDQNLAGEPRDTVKIESFVVNEGNYFSVNDPLLERMLYFGTLSKTVLMAGALERVLDLTIAYSTERKQFGRPISRFQAIQQHIAVMSAEVTAAAIAVDTAIESFTGEPSDDITVAKIRVSDAASIVTPIAHQVHGAIGFTDEHILHQSTRRLWSWRDEFGSESEWAERLGEQIIQNGSEGLWSFITN
ncbi:hypothetical protein DCC39_15470 [Pueribacillus theae]|uniref:Acyl-CoA dehydrogenase n=1 Tax=Pueribacillus theae TaxID=2171751 RepID=A0A2U1JT48_9BACI|nr:acyl-CoA dehydrogenase family protein [Pueribacillus theae]PWA08124.1 hypothetical protein DCC39_15470 [Pueribacillus theae]